MRKGLEQGKGLASGPALEGSVQGRVQLEVRLGQRQIQTRQGHGGSRSSGFSPQCDGKPLPQFTGVS